MDNTEWLNIVINKKNYKQMEYAIVSQMVTFFYGGPYHNMWKCYTLSSHVRPPPLNIFYIKFD
jgi:hypothetical protein